MFTFDCRNETSSFKFIKVLKIQLILNCFLNCTCKLTTKIQFQFNCSSTKLHFHFTLILCHSKTIKLKLTMARSICSPHAALIIFVLLSIELIFCAPSNNSSSICGRTHPSCCSSLVVNDGYLKLRDNFTVGDRITIDMKIKPWTKSGALLWVAGENDFLILQMINRTIEFTVDNGDGLITASSKLTRKVVQDGGWYDVSISKHGSMISLQVDNKDFSITLGPGNNSSTDTFGRLLLAGVPKYESVLGLRTSQPFSGCIRDVEISGEQMQLQASDDYHGSISFKSCKMSPNP